jgi:hypothetical protein
MGQHEAAGPPGDDPDRDPGLLDDFELIAERARVTATLAALTDRYCQLNHEMNQRKTLQWMLR